MRRTLTAVLALLFLVLPVFAQEYDPSAAMTPPSRPADLRLPAGVEIPDLTGYEIVELRPDMDPLVALELVSAKSRNRGAVAWRFAPGTYDQIDVVKHDDGPDTRTSFWKDLWRNRVGTRDKPQYIGPLDPAAPLPVLPTEAFLSNSSNLHIQGLILTGMKFGHVPLSDPAAPVLVEGCWIDGGVFVQSSREKDGTPRPARDITIRRCWLMGSGGQGIYGNDCRDILIEECVIDYAGGDKTKDHGIYIADAVGLVVRRCIISRASSSALKLNEGKDVLFEDNLIVRCHNWATVNGNPREGKPGSQGAGFVARGNIVTSMGRKQNGKGGQGYFGWSFRDVVVRDNLFIHLQPGRPFPASPIMLLRPFFGPELNEFAGPLEGMVVSGNLFASTGALVHLQTQDGVPPDVRDISIRGNLVASIDYEDPTARAALLRGDPGLLAGEEFTIEGNVSPPWVASPLYDLGPLSLAGEGAARKATVRNPDATIHTWAGSLGATPDDAGFFGLLSSGLSPHELIDDALLYFRAAYEVVSVESAPVPASLPWLDGAQPPDPEEEDPPVIEEPDPPVEEDPGEDPNPSEIPNGSFFAVEIGGITYLVPRAAIRPVRYEDE